jgi:DNA-binding transcriptional ArsR family regulator/ubiquinone/menaquinone biosynthesis C-methylase UbiE
MLAVSNTSADLEIDELAALNKAAADVMRLQILQLLQQDSFGVLEIADIFEVSQSRMSHHLKILASAGLLTTRREGNSIFYRRAVMGSDTVDLVRGSILKAVDHLEPNASIQTAVARIYQERAMQSQTFFEKHAGKFTDVQDLIAGYEHYADSVNDVMQALVLPENASAMEVGPGQGGFLKPLTDMFQHVIALDNSPAMLDVAKEHCEQGLQEKIQFVLGEPETALKQNIKVDFLAFNMVVHHIPSPSDVIQSAAQLLNQDGYLLITDLCPHNQSWVKESCGDLWLGLDPDDLNQWASDSGLIRQHQVFVSLRNGFQIQIQLFKKTTF